MNRLKQTFQLLNENNAKAFVPYMMAGDGGLDCLIDRLAVLEKLGATAIEVGVPFSDPVADGPIIQSAGLRALKANTTLKGIIKELAKAREIVSIPIILMSYLNPIYAYGIDSFVRDIQLAGIDGCIIPDMPIEEEEILAPKLTEVEVELIRLVTPATPIERIKLIAERGNGFLYTVTVKGITGTRNMFNSELNMFFKAVKELSPIPVLAGFGISNKEQIIELIKYCDGVVVGSKIVDLFNENNLMEMEKFISIFNREAQSSN